MTEQEKQQLNEPITKQYLGEFTENVLLPAIGRMIDPLEKRIASLEVRIQAIEERMNKLEDEMAGLSNKVTRYLELTDKRYLELKRRDAVLTKWVKQIADKTGVEIDLQELEKF